MRFHTAYGLDVPQLDIVVIDDNEHSLAITETILKAFRVSRLRCFQSAEEALYSMTDSPPNLLITDWIQSSIGGFEFVKELRHVDVAPLCYLPIVMLTAKSRARHEEKAAEHGVSSFLKKPISAQDLYTALADVTQDRRRLVAEGNYFAIEKSSGKMRRVGVA